MPDIISSPESSIEELREEVARLRLIHSISLEFSASLDFDELLPKVFHRVLAALGAEGGSIWIAEGDVLRCRTRRGASRASSWSAPRCRSAPGSSATWPSSRRTTMVTRAVEDPRFQPALDSGDALATTVMATAMVAGGVTVGAIQVANKLTGDGIFDQRDRDLLEGLAASAAAALRNAQLHSVEKRAGDLAVLLEISREITATLDLDRVLQSVVNLASRALPFDRGAVALYEKGHCEIRAVAGQETVDPKDPKLQDLVARAEWAAGRGEPLYLSRARGAASDAERMFVTIFGPDLETRRSRERALPAAQGRRRRARRAGVRVGHSRLRHARPSARSRPSWPTRPRSRSGTRSSTTRCPMVDALGALAAKKTGVRAIPRRRLQIYAAIAVALVARGAGPVPLAAPGGRRGRRLPAVALRSGAGAGSRAWSSGCWCTRERGRAGCAARDLRATDLRADREATAAEAAAADRSAALAASRGDAAEERLHRIRGDALRREVALLDEEVELTTVRAPAAGMVLTPHVQRAGRQLARGRRPAAHPGPHRLAGARVRRAISATSRRVRPGQEVRSGWTRCRSGPSSARVQLGGPVPLDSGTTVRYPVRALVANPDGLLEAEMAAYARVLTDPASSALDPAVPRAGPLAPALLVEDLVVRCLPCARGPARGLWRQPAPAFQTAVDGNRVAHRAGADRRLGGHGHGRTAAQRCRPSSTWSTTPPCSPARRAWSSPSWPTSARRVRAGQLLARLESTDQEIALAQAREQSANAQQRSSGSGR